MKLRGPIPAEKLHPEIEEDDNWVSRSSRRRHSKALHAIAETMASLSQSEFDRLDFGADEILPRELRHAREYKKLTQFEPYRRQMLHVERIMRTLPEEEVESLKKSIESATSRDRSTNPATRRLEKLRDALLGENSAEELNKLAGEHREIDRAKLRSMISKIKKGNREDPACQERYRELFRYLRDTIKQEDSNSLNNSAYDEYSEDSEYESDFDEFGAMSSEE